MKKIWLLTLFIVSLFITGCFNNRQDLQNNSHDLPKCSIIFEQAGIDWNRAIWNEWKYYLEYSTIKPKWTFWDSNYAFWDCLWYVWENKNDRIYELSWESRDEWLIEYNVNGKIAITTVLREVSLSNEDYIPESVKKPVKEVCEWDDCDVSGTPVCVRYFDWCNRCSFNDDFSIMCTEEVCEEYQEAYCGYSR